MRAHRFGQEILYTATHGFKQKLVVWWIRGRTSNQLHSWTDPPKLRAECKIRFRITGKVKENQVGQRLRRLRRSVAGNRPLLDRFHSPGLLQTGKQMR